MNRGQIMDFLNCDENLFDFVQLRHWYGIEVFTLCMNDNTISFSIYASQESISGVTVSGKIVMELNEKYLDEGRIMYNNNWYTSATLANQFLTRPTNLVGTLRSNKKFNPETVVKAKLKKREIVASQSKNNIAVLKWKDKHGVFML